MTQNDFVSVDHLLSTIVHKVGDEGYKRGVQKGRYISWIQDAIQELAMDTFFFKIVKDYPMPQNCQLELPSDMFNLREIYVFKGELCSVKTSQNVYWKRQFNNMSDGEGYTAKIKDDGSNSGDLFVPNHDRYRMYNFPSYSKYRYYYNVYNGILMLSKDCLGYDNVRIIANTFGGEIGDLPVIPRFFERAVEDFVKVQFYEAMKSRDPRTYRILWQDAKNDLEDPVTGSWNKARKRVKSMNTAEKESVEEYISSMLHK